MMISSHVTTAAAICMIGAGAFLAGRFSKEDVAKEAAASERLGPANSTRSVRGGNSEMENRTGSSHTTTGGHPKRAEQAGTKEARLAKLEEIVKGTDPIERSRAFLAFLDKLDPSEIKDAVDHFRALGMSQERMGEYSMLLTLWANTDPTAALAYAKANTHSGFAQKTIISAWAARDPGAAILWAKANHKGDDANPYMSGIISGIAETDPAWATQLLVELPFGGERGEALAGLLPQIISQGPDATREWINAITDERLRNGAIARVAEQLAALDPKGTADWLLANPGEASQRSMDNVISAWMDKDKDAAVAYYQELPAGDVRSNALRGVVNSLAVDNPREAANFMDNHAGDVTDRVVQQFVWHSYGEDADLAVSYIAKISDPAEREGTYRRMIDNWLERDQSAARAWIQSNPLSESLQAHFQRSLQKLDGQTQ